MRRLLLTVLVTLGVTFTTKSQNLNIFQAEKISAYDQEKEEWKASEEISGVTIITFQGEDMDVYIDDSSYEYVRIEQISLDSNDKYIIIREAFINRATGAQVEATCYIPFDEDELYIQIMFYFREIPKGTPANFGYYCVRK